MRRRLVGQFAVAVLAATLGAVAAQAPAQAAPGDGWETITTDMGTGYVLGIAGGSDANGARAITWPALYVSDQAWKWQRVGSSVPYVWALLNGGTNPNKALAVSGGREDDGAPIIQYDFNAANPDQLWRQEGTWRPGTFILRNVKSKKCLAVPNGNTAPGVKLIQYGCNDLLADQRWTTVDN
ncbi:RICIN domain-containing protein [Actinoplanes sp. NPDC051861]|uniref:RICIN domain-containing protein n=1 Tax=Actinoplanes sp. NPDC051861 TaxID=3155170 RepID=UPI00342B3FEE